MNITSEPVLYGILAYTGRVCLCARFKRGGEGAGGLLLDLTLIDRSTQKNMVLNTVVHTFMCPCESVYMSTYDGCKILLKIN